MKKGIELGEKFFKMAGDYIDQVSKDIGENEGELRGPDGGCRELSECLLSSAGLILNRAVLGLTKKERRKRLKKVCKKIDRVCDKFEKIENESND